MEESKSAKVVNFVPKELQFQDELVLGTRQTFSGNQVLRTTPASNLQPSPGSSLDFDVSVTSTSMLSSKFSLSGDILVKYKDNAGVAATIITDQATAFSNLSNEIGLQPFCWSRIINFCSERMNGMSLNSNPNEIVASTLYSHSKDELRNLSPLAVPDHEYSYNETVNGSVLRSASDAAYFTRGVGACPVEIAAFSLGDNTITLRYSLEEILLSRLSTWAHPDAAAYRNVKDLKVKMTFVSDFINNMICNINTDIGVEDVTIENFKLNVRQFIPTDTLKLDYSKPNYTRSPNLVVDRKAVSAAVAAGATGSVESNPRTLTTVPSVIIAYLEVPATSHTPARFLPFRSLTLEVGNKRNILRDYTPSELYNISRKNGYNGTLAQFVGGYGSVLTNGCMMIMTPSDFETDAMFQSNVRANFTMKLSATFVNKHSAAVTPTLNVVIVHDHYLMLQSDGKYFDVEANLDQNDVVSAEPMFLNANLTDNRVMGGSVWGWIKKAVKSKLFKGLSKLARNNIPIVNKYVGDNTAVGKTIANAGYGPVAGNGIINLGGQQVSNAALLAQLA